MELLQVDPKTLVIGQNVRSEPELDEEFEASIKARGVRVPIEARRNAAGELEVVAGQRRTLAAVKKGLETVPVLVDRDDSRDEAGVLIDQISENDRRAALTENDRVKGWEQLAALGVSAVTIAEQSGEKVRRIKTGLSVAANSTASQALAKYPLTIDQAAALIEFADDKTACADLVAAAERGKFEHTLQSLQDRREEKAAAEKLRAELDAAGIPVIDRYSCRYTELKELLTADGKQLTAKNHADCSGRSAYLSPTYSSTKERWRVVHVCTTPGKAGHKAKSGGSMSGTGLSEEEKAERRQARENNKAWRSVLLTEPPSPFGVDSPERWAAWTLSTCSFLKVG